MASDVGRPEDDLQVNIAPELVLATQDAGHGVELCHGAVGRSYDAGREKQAENLAPAQVFHEGPGRFLGGQRATPDVRAVTQRTILAVVYAVVREQGLEHHGIAAIGQRDWIQPFAIRAPSATVPITGSTGTGQIVLRIR